MDNSATPRYCAFVLGALLHDIGKLVERAKEGSAGQEHTYSGEKWFEANLDNGLSAIFDDEERQIVRSATSSHHKGLDYISLADSTAVGMDQIKLEDEEPVNSHADALTSVFSYVSLSHKVKSPKYHRVEWLGSEGLEELFPVDNEQSLQPRYSALLDGFNREIRTVRFGSLGPLTVIDAVYFLLWKYAWCVPSGDKNEPGVSLFDHLRITAALTSCLYTYHQGSLGQTLNAQSAAFSLIGGDVSGIQGYIFDVLTQQGKVAKRLRSRSFFVQLIAETAAHKVLHAFALPLSNLVMSAGGNFYILAPNTQDGHAKIEALQKEFDEWTLDRLNGELNVNLAATKISGSDMADFSKVLDAIRFELTYRKNQPHKSALVSGAKWLEEKFLRPEVIQGDEKICQSCRKRPRQEFVSNAENLCECCLSDTKLGQMLPKSKYLAFFRDAVHEFKALNYSFELWPKGHLASQPPDNGPYMVLTLNSTQACAHAPGFKYLVTHVPTKTHISPMDTGNDQTITFDDIANMSHGDRLLGYVKADVDNLGKILREGFSASGLSIARFSAFSRMLDTFFSGYLQAQLVSAFPGVYAIFSGGDDFCVVGPWDQTIEFVRLVREKFSHFCAGNPDLTFSSGIFLSQPHEPVSFCSRKVEERLSSSKAHDSKDRVTLFNQTVAWDELDHLLKQVHQMIEWVNADPPVVSRAFAFRLWEYGRMANRSGIFDVGGRIETKFLKFVPLLVYDINRNLTDSQQEALSWLLSLRPTKEKPYGGNNLAYLKTIMEYVLTYTRS